MDIYRILYQNPAECTFTSSAYRMWIEICWVIKERINKYQGTEITWSVSSDHKGIKLKITNSYLKCLEVDTFLNNVWAIEKIHK